MLNKPEKYEAYRVAALERARSFHWTNVLPKACDWLEGQAKA